MSKTDILGELPKLGPNERREILERIWEIEEAELLAGAQPDAAEKALLDQEWEELKVAPNAGSEWSEVRARLQKQAGS